MELVSSLRITVQAISTILFSAFALLIVLRAGDERGNVALAIAIAVVFSVDTIFNVLFPYCATSGSLLYALRMSLFALASGFYVRATQLFPLPLSQSGIYNSPTIWGRIAVTRYLLAKLLRPWITWVMVVSVSALAFFAPFGSAVAVTRIALILVGVAYFHISFSSGDVIVRRKVLWFLLAVLSVVILSVISVGFRTTIGPSMGVETRSFVSLGINGASKLIMLACFSTAVFYAGAISPTLVLRKTFVYGAAIALLLFTFSVLQDLTIDVLVEGFGVSGRFLDAILGTTLGLAFYPITKRVESLLARAGKTDRVDSERRASEG